nr:hypothetical protein Itr_chr09CG12580 [Ipomoea trifida]
MCSTISSMYNLRLTGNYAHLQLTGKSLPQPLISLSRSEHRQIMTGKRGGYQLGKSFCDKSLTIACKFARDSCAHQLGKYDPRFIGSACRPGFVNHHLL